MPHIRLCIERGKTEHWQGTDEYQTVLWHRIDVYLDIITPYTEAAPAPDAAPEAAEGEGEAAEGEGEAAEGEAAEGEAAAVEEDWVLNCSLRVVPALAHDDPARWVWIPKDQSDELDEEDEEDAPEWSEWWNRKVIARELEPLLAGEAQEEVLALGEAQRQALAAAFDVYGKKQLRAVTLELLVERREPEEVQPDAIPMQPDDIPMQPDAIAADGIAVQSGETRFQVAE